MPASLDTVPVPVTAPTAVDVDELRPQPPHTADRCGTTGRSAPYTLPTRSALAEVTVLHGQLEVVAARLALMTARPDLRSNEMDLLDAAQQVRRALLFVHQAQLEIEATAASPPVGQPPPSLHTGSADEIDFDTRRARRTDGSTPRPRM